MDLLWNIVFLNIKVELKEK